MHRRQNYVVFLYLDGNFEVLVTLTRHSSSQAKFFLTYVLWNVSETCPGTTIVIGFSRCRNGAINLATTTTTTSLINYSLSSIYSALYSVTEDAVIQ